MSSILEITQIAENAHQAANVLKALANEQRMLILCLLANNELSVNELNEKIALSQSALSQHLARLRKDALVHTRRQGQTIFYKLPQGLASDIVKLCYQYYCENKTKRDNKS